MISKLLLIVGIVAATISQVQAGCDGCCTMCGKRVCQVTVSMEKEKTDCFEVECEEICIPPVCFPWQKKPAVPACSAGCADAYAKESVTSIRKCGKVRTVKKLVTEEREVDVCVYDWEVVIICAQCRQHGSSAAVSYACDDRIDCDLIPFQDHVFLGDPAQSELVRDRGAPLITPTGDLLYGPVEKDLHAPVHAGP